MRTRERKSNRKEARQRGPPENTVGTMVFYTTHGATDNMQKLKTMEDWLSTPGAIDAAIIAMIRRMIRNAERRQKTQSGKGKT